MVMDPLGKASLVFLGADHMATAPGLQNCRTAELQTKRIQTHHHADLYGDKEEYIIYVCFYSQ